PRTALGAGPLVSLGGCARSSSAPRRAAAFRSGTARAEGVVPFAMACPAGSRARRTRSPSPPTASASSSSTRRRTSSRRSPAPPSPADGERFALFNASPHVLAQIARAPALAPPRGRGSPIAAVVLTNGDLDHVLGLFSLRESTPLALYATVAVFRGLEASVLL